MSPVNESTAPFESNEEYRQLRLKLILFYERRNCPCPEDLADECMARVFIYVKAHGLPTGLAKLTFGFATNVHFEWLRERSRTASMDPDLPDVERAGPSAEESRVLAEKSVAQLDPEDRELMEQYYLDKRTAESLAAEWGLSPEGIRSRIFRKRRRLVKFLLDRKAEGETNWRSPDIND